MDLVQDHRERCTECGSCFDECIQYDDERFIEDLYRYLEGERAEVVSEDIFRCLMCGRCKAECPEGIGMVDLVRAAREKWYAENGLQPISFHVDPAYEKNIYRIIDERREIPSFPEGEGEIVYRPGCYATHIHPTIAQASARLLDLAGIDYWVQIDTPEDSTCCGMVSAAQGNKRPVMEQGKKNVEEVRSKGARKMLVTCPVCYKAFKNVYPSMLGDLDLEVIHVTEFLNQLVKEGKLVPRQRLDHKVYYHDPCHMSVGLGVDKAPRELIQSIPGTTLLNPTMEGSTCCGYSGGMRMNHPTESIRISADEIDRVAEMGGDVIITNCPGCTQNLIEAKLGNPRVEIMDLVEYLLMAFEETLERDDESTIQLVNLAYAESMPDYVEPDLSGGK